MSQQSPIFVKTEAFMKWLLGHTGKFPKSERFRLAKRIDDALFDFHTALILAAKSRDKATHLQMADVALQKLRAYLRLSMEIGHTSANQYGYAAQQVTEIGNLLGAWRKQSQ